VIDNRKKPRRSPSTQRIVWLCALCALCGFFFVIARAAQPHTIRFVFTSDAHYGISRPHFRGRDNVEAPAVNAAMVDAINHAGPLDFVVQGGDLANREEETEAGPIQSAAVSWSQFAHDYIDGLTAVTPAGRKAPLYLVPGNHEVSNAIGFYKPMRPLIDKTALLEIYNRTMTPSRPKTAASYDYARDRVLYSHTLSGVHFVFITIWPDSIVRAWLENDLRQVDRSTPVVLFTHDQPEAQAKHFTNPNGAHTLTAPTSSRTCWRSASPTARRSRPRPSPSSASSNAFSSVTATSAPTSTATRTGTSSTTGTVRPARWRCTPSASTRR
jgi:predicted MPP superfamily phosphohydrolase